MSSLSTVGQSTSLHPNRAELTSRSQSRFAFRAAVISAFVYAIAAVIFVITAFSQPYWQMFVLAGSSGVGLLFSLFAINLGGQSNARLRVFLIVPVTAVIFVVISSIVNQTALVLSVIGFLLSTILLTGALEGRGRETGITLAFFAALLTLLVGTYSPFPQIRLPQIDIVLPILLSAVLMVYIILLMQEIVTANLRIKLLTGSLAIAILPLIIVSVIDSRFIQNALRDQSDQALQLAAEQTAAKIDTFFIANTDAITKESLVSVFADYLIVLPSLRSGSQQETAVRLTLESLASRQQRFLHAYGLLDVDGVSVIDSNPNVIGTSESSSEHFIQAMNTGQVYSTSVVFDGADKSPHIYFASPIRNQRQQIVGILRAQFDAHILQDILTEQINWVGNRSHPILLDENHLRLADTLAPRNLHRLLAALPIEQMGYLIENNRLPDLPIYQMTTNDFELAAAVNNYLANSFFSLELHQDDPNHIEHGAIVRIKTKPWYVLFVQEQAAFTNLMRSQGQLSILISTLVAGLVGLFATVIAGNFSNPIVRLQETAEKISSGDLNAQVQVETGDEIGLLARAFTFMTNQLRSLINELEDRVRERTQELAQQNVALLYRTRQLQTVSDVARGIVSTQQLETLLNQLTVLISERFGFYHVGVFLLDSLGEYAVLRAANSEGGQRMLARQHRLRVGQVGIVGHASGSGQPRIATDVGQDAVYFNNPDLPQTRSEMALPLLVNQKVIGVLDVQSTEANAFSQEDIELFGILADQIAIAIQNNRLYVETLHALEESQRVHRQYLQQEWGKETSSRKNFGYRATPTGLDAHAAALDPKVTAALHDGQPVSRTAASSKEPALLAVPIRLRGETIGLIQLEDNSIQDRVWSEEEINSILAVADQVGLALENARLLEKTIRRADRERRVLQITSKIRSTNDPQSMINIAVQELQRSLNASRAQIILTSASESHEPDNGHPKTPGNGSGNPG